MVVATRVGHEHPWMHLRQQRASKMRRACLLGHIIVLLAIVAGCGSTSAGRGGLESGATKTKEEQDRDRKEAQRFFEEGRRLVAAGDLVAACTTFEKSQAIDPGAGTLYHLADCYVRIGKTASAYELFKEVVELSQKANRPDREKLATDRVKALESSLSRLTILAPWVAPNTPFAVYLNGREVPRADWGHELLVDSGVHNISATMPGFMPWNHVVHVGKLGIIIEAAIPQSVQEWRPITMRRFSPVMMGFGIASIGVGAIMLPIGGLFCGTTYYISNNGYDSAVDLCDDVGAPIIITGTALVLVGITFTLVGARVVPVSDEVKKKRSDARLHIAPGSIGISGSF